MDSLIESKFLQLARDLGAKNPQIDEDDDYSDEIADAHSTRYTLRDVAEGAVDPTDALASGMISDFPNCCGIAVFGEASASHPKWLRWMFLLREAIARRENKGLAVQTHHANNAEILRAMRSLRWRAACPNWKNPNSGNRVTMWSKVLK